MQRDKTKCSTGKPHHVDSLSLSTLINRFQEKYTPLYYNNALLKENVMS